ncbi:Hypothetical protein AA314_06713 [Archangium gephyra]|uniref:Uncharacterized protein n=1 Tax=Archangium gephyra TaxID=48 RepID=A0AAC8TGE6_9BACT|nr:Hypothetical protein AA314_06713 [Archangium gephyra]
MSVKGPLHCRPMSTGRPSMNCVSHGFRLVLRSRTVGASHG